MSTKHHCPVCGHLLIVTNVVLKPGEFLQAHCKKCKRERRFEGK